MARLCPGGRAAGMAAIIVTCASIAACGSDGSSSATAQTVSTTTGSFPIDRSPTVTAAALQIKGSPVTTATAGQLYSFKPTVAGNTATTLKFSIANTPSWAKFDASSGTLSGTPASAQVGTYPGILISVIQGSTTAALPAFSIVVAEPNSISNVALSWQAPTENADGSALIDLKGYKVHYGTASKTYSQTIQVANPGLTTYVVQNLDAGKYYFAVTAYNAAGQESSLSPEVSTQVD
jgi:hypothetical protein